MQKQHFDSAIARLSEYFGTKVNDVQNQELWRFMQSWSEESLRGACRWLTENYTPASYKRFPLKSDFQLAKEKTYKHKQEQYQPEGEMATTEEVKAIMEIVKLIIDCHNCKLMFNGSVLEIRNERCLPMNIYDWHKQGCPPTWSPLYDEVARGMLQAMKHGSLEKYLKEWCVILRNMLIDGRKK